MLGGSLKSSTPGRWKCERLATVKEEGRAGGECVGARNLSTRAKQRRPFDSLAFAPAVEPRNAHRSGCGTGERESRDCLDKDLQPRVFKVVPNVAAEGWKVESSGSMAGLRRLAIEKMSGRKLCPPSSFVAYADVPGPGKCIKVSSIETISTNAKGDKAPGIWGASPNASIVSTSAPGPPCRTGTIDLLLALASQFCTTADTHHHTHSLANLLRGGASDLPRRWEQAE